jgi:hypothetical protein
VAELLGREAAPGRRLDLARLGEADRDAHDRLRRALRELTSSKAGLGLAEDGVDPCVLALEGRRLAMLTPRPMGAKSTGHAITYRSLGPAEDLALRIDGEVERGPRGKITRRSRALSGPAGDLNLLTRTPHDLGRGPRSPRRGRDEAGRRAPRRLTRLLGARRWPAP